MRRFLLLLLSTAVLIPVFSQDIAEGQGIAYSSNTNGLYASHATFPFGTHLIVTNMTNHKEVTVRVGGRLRPGGRYVVELSPKAAEAIGLRQGTTAAVRVERVVSKPKAAVAAATGTAAVKAPEPKVARKNSITFYAIRLEEGEDEYYAYSNALDVGSKVIVTNPGNNRQTIVDIKGKIEDWPGGEMMELSSLAAETLDIPKRATVDVLPQ